MRNVHPLPPVPVGDRMYIEVETRDHRQASRPRYDPDRGVALSIFDPTGVSHLDEQLMARIATGRYTWEFQLPGNGPTGVWRVNVISLHGPYRIQSGEYAAWVVVGDNLPLLGGYGVGGYGEGGYGE